MKYNLNQRSGSLTCEVRRNRMLTSTFLMVVVLVGIIAASASANAQTTLSVKPGWDVFDPGGDGVKFFGVLRFSRSTHTREDAKATHDAFLLGEFFTDRFGNGRRSFELDLSGVPPGSYDAHFTSGQLSDLRGHYRTGSKYGAGFAKIVVP